MKGTPRMKRIASFSVLLSVALIMIVAVATGFAQDHTQAPTYEQTQKWIVSKLIEGGYTHKYSGAHNITGSYEKISMDDCRLLYTAVVFDPGDGYIPDTTFKWETMVPLDQASDVFIKHFVDGSMAEWDVFIKSPITMRLITTKRGVVGEEIENHKSDESRLIFGRSPSTTKTLQHE